MEGKRVVVVVLGDLAQSPRMVAHVRSLCQAGASVSLVGYIADAALPDLPATVDLNAIGGPGTSRWRDLPRLAYLPLAGLRAGIMTLRLRRVLRRAFHNADMALIQVPPAVPALPLALAEARRAGIGVVIDWHNLSHAMLALRLGRDHRLVGLLRRLEGHFGRQAAGHLAVTPVLASRLEELWQIEGAAMLPDRPARVEAPLEGSERTAALARLLAVLGGDPAFRPHRVLVSPTSWSLDEEMDMLLDALGRLGADGKPILLIATGRGPGREAFLRRAAVLQGAHLHIVTGWLSEEDFRLSLRAADLGISLHRSASQADFPMKISDMVGAGLPVLALDYGPGLRAGLPPAPAAETFTDAEGLAAHLRVLGTDAALAEARSAARLLGGPWNETWDQAWTRQARPVFTSVMEKG
ncbi:glycosyltransferase [Telmatospirillum sp. J64-1]|uniref:glycosyltransferase n=1 Tax=Telmatospirillum sp. J64-1 TaxID=2502183 RepID=UPI00163DD578|nr:glycosyltransferase [Telmatospirillum sp. J64-1]